VETKLKRLLLCVPIFLSILLVSCSRETGDRFAVLSGVLSWARQDWSGAAVNFIRVADSARNDETSLIRDYALYGLASTYLAQEEYDSALMRLAEISPESPSEIRSGIWYQIGVAAYRKGLYDQACTYFRQALEIDSAAVDAKINLELCRRSMHTSESSAAASAPGISESGQNEDQSEILFSLVRRKEQERWKNRQNESNPGLEDY